MEFAPMAHDVGQINFNIPPPSMRHQTQQHSNNLIVSAGNHHHHHMSGGLNKSQPYFRPFNNFARGPGGQPMTQDDFDGKRLRKSVMRKTVDYNASIVRSLENRVWQRDHRDRHALQPESIYVPELLPPPSYMDNPSNAVTTKFVKTATNKMRCPIFTLAWTPEGRRLVTGASSGEFTLWNGLTFNFETILQAHDVSVRTMVWSHNDSWMVTGDHAGYVKYWQSNMNNVKMFQAHKEPIRGISFSPSDSKFVSCSDDGTLRVWDFLRCQEERVLRGHGADVKCVHWHPQKALIVSGSKDNQQPIKLWDPKSGQALATLHAHKSTVMDLKWNANGNWLVTASRDHLLKLFDLRNLREEVQIFRGHKKEASAVSWHPVHEGLFSSGGSDGSILFWNVGTDKEVGVIDQAHESIVWTLAWHPLGHILCSGSNDHTIKFWTRNRPGDQMRDKYNLNTLPPSLAGLDECEIAEENHVIPGMGPEDKIDFTESLTADKGFIPGLDLDTKNVDDKKDKEKKVPYSKPIPRNFQAQWNDTGRSDDFDEATSKEIKEVITQIVENTPGAVPLQKITPTAIIVYGKVIQVQPGSELEKAILNGPEALNRYISSGEIEELVDVMPFEDNSNLSRPDSRNSNDDSKSPGPPQKKPRFEDTHDHNAKIVYGNDFDNQLGTSSAQIGSNNLQQEQLLSLDQQHKDQKSQSAQPGQIQQTQLQQQQLQSQKSSIPSLLGLKVEQPKDFSPPLRSPQDQDYRNFNFSEEPRQGPWAAPINPSTSVAPFIAPNFNQNVFNANQNMLPMPNVMNNFNNFNDGQFCGPQNNFAGNNLNNSTNGPSSSRDNRSHSNSRMSGNSRNNDNFNRKNRRQQQNDRNDRSNRLQQHSRVRSNRRH